MKSHLFLLVALYASTTAAFAVAPPGIAPAGPVTAQQQAPQQPAPSPCDDPDLLRKAASALPDNWTASITKKMALEFVALIEDRPMTKTERDLEINDTLGAIAITVNDACRTKLDKAKK